MEIPVIPQLERSRQKAALSNNSISTPTTGKYVPPAQRCHMTGARGCHQTSSESHLLCKHHEIQSEVSCENTDLRTRPTASQPLAKPSFWDSGRRHLSHERHTEERKEIEVWTGRRKGGNRAPVIEPEGTKSWRTSSPSSDSTATKLPEAPSRAFEEQKESKDKDSCQVELLFEIRISGKNSDTSPTSVALARESESSEFETSEGAMTVSHSQKEGECFFRDLCTKYQSVWLRCRSRVFPNTLSEEENMIRNYMYLCKEWHIDPALYLDDVLSYLRSNGLRS